MESFNKIISDAKVVITDINMHTGDNLNQYIKMNNYINELASKLEVLQKSQNQSILGRFKDAMLDTEDDFTENEISVQIINLTYQLNNCLYCRCISCGMFDENCRCEGCLYGSHVTECDGGNGIETRKFEEGVCTVDNMPIVTAQFDRISKQTAIALVDLNGIESHYLFDPVTGKKSRI